MIASFRAASAMAALLAITAEASAENLDAGKSPSQLFSGNCAACHRSAKGLAKSPNVGQISGFLRQHYTSSREMAGTLAAYVVGAGVDPGGRRAREATRDSGRPDARGERQETQAARPEPAPPEGTPAPSREERAAARRAAAEAEAKRLDRLERSRVGLTSGGDPAPVQISQQPIALAHDRHSSRADPARIYTPPKPVAETHAAEKPAAEKPAVTAALPTPAPEIAAAPPAQSGTPTATLTPEAKNPAGAPAGLETEPAPPIGGAAPTGELQPFSAPLP